MPPSVTAAFKRNGDFLKRTFSLETLLRPLPAPLVEPPRSFKTAMAPAEPEMLNPRAA